jgi:hypothetical protein
LFKLDYIDQWKLLSTPCNVSLILFTAYRLDNFMVGVTNTAPAVGQALTVGPNYTKCAQYIGSIPCGATVYVVCAPTSVKYRYVILQGMLTSADHFGIQEVEVFGMQ